MFRPYREVLSLPGAWRFSLAGFVARLPISMLGIGIVLLISNVSGSYALAGAVSAVYTVAQAVVSPALARLVDRKGQSRIMIPTVSIQVVAVSTLLTSVLLDWPLFVVFLAAAVSGVTVGSVGSLVRARWAHAVERPTQLHTAFSWESVVDELIFIAGPVAVTILATNVFAGAGLVSSLIAVIVGSALFYSQRSSEPPPVTQQDSGGGSVIRNVGVIVVIIVFIVLGTAFGSIDVIIVAFTKAEGVPAMAGVVIALFALGSLLAGVIYGSIQWHIPVGRRFVGTVVLLALGSTTLLLAHNVVGVSIVLFVVGFTIAPTLIGGNSVIQTLAPPGRLTEGLAWVGTALGIGVSLGSAGAGIVIDSHGPHTAFLVPVIATATAAVVALIGDRSLTPRAPAAAPVAGESADDDAKTHDGGTGVGGAAVEGTADGGRELT